MNNDDKNTLNPEQPFEGRLEHAPDALVAQLVLQAQDHLEHKRFDRAAPIAQVLVHMRPDAAPMWTLLGHVYRRERRFGPALKALTHATKLDSSDRSAMVELGEVLCLVGRPVEGLELVRAVFEMGREQGQPPAAQDPLTIRAGALLEGVQKGIALARASQTPPPNQ